MSYFIILTNGLLKCNNRLPFCIICSIIIFANAPVAQRIEQWPPEPCEEVRLFSGAVFLGELLCITTSIAIKKTLQPIICLQ